MVGSEVLGVEQGALFADFGQGLFLGSRGEEGG